MTALQEDITAGLFQKFNKAAAVLGLNEAEQKSVLGLVKPQTTITPEFIISSSIDAQARAKSIIGIADSLEKLSLALGHDIPALKKDFFSSHKNMVNYLSENYDHSERVAQIFSCLRASEYKK